MNTDVSVFRKFPIKERGRPVFPGRVLQPAQYIPFQRSDYGCYGPELHANHFLVRREADPLWLEAGILS